MYSIWPKSLDGLDDLDGDVERDGDDVLEDDEARAKDDKRIDNVAGAKLCADLVVSATRVGATETEAANDGADAAKDHEDDKVDDDVEVGLLLDFGALGGRLARVEHDLGVLAGEDDDADDPICVAKGATSEEELVDGDGLDAAGASLDGGVGAAVGRQRFERVGELALLGGLAGGVLEQTVVAVEVGMGRLGVDDEAGVLEILLGLNAHGGLERLAHLEEDDVADLELLPQGALPASCPGRVSAVVDDALDGRAVGEEGGCALLLVLLVGLKGLMNRDAACVCVGIGAVQIAIERGIRVVVARAVEALVVALTFAGDGVERMRARQTVAANAACVGSGAKLLGIGAGGAAATAADLAHADGVLLFAQLAHALGDLAAASTGQTEELLVPGARIFCLVEVAPVAETGDGRVVDLVVEHVSAMVLDGVLDGGDGEDSDERKHGDLRDGRTKGGKDLEDDEAEKVDVGDAAELLEEESGEEGDDGVLGGADLVAWIDNVRIAVAAQLGAGRRLVEVDVSALLWLHLAHGGAGGLRVGLGGRGGFGVIVMRGRVVCCGFFWHRALLCRGEGGVCVRLVDRDAVGSALLGLFGDHLCEGGAFLLLFAEGASTEELVGEAVGAFCLASVVSALFGAVRLGDGSSCCAHRLEL
ncbi:hypothetical protein L1887_56808 [Cichorium endivia]|nr:hypothetical protein L1887_56808 [Cichorium endivia]